MNSSNHSRCAAVIWDSNTIFSCWVFVVRKVGQLQVALAVRQHMGLCGGGGKLRGFLR
jgi:hypothetical protein